MGSKKKGIAEEAYTGREEATYSVRVIEKAEKDADDIVDFISNKRDQTLNGTKVIDALQRKIARIGLNPWAFKECEEIPTVSKMYRKVSCYSWSIIYKITRTEVIILGIIHQSAKASRIKALRRIK